MSFVAERVREHYEALGAGPRLGCAPGALSAFESAHSLSLPRAFADFYLSIDGLDEEVPDFGAHALQLWPLAEVSRVSERVAEYRGVPDYGPIVTTLPDADQYIAFGDGMCWSHVLAARLSDGAGPVLWICGGSYVRVAQTFDEFWARYLENPDSVLWPDENEIISAAV